MNLHNSILTKLAIVFLLVMSPFAAGFANDLERPILVEPEWLVNHLKDNHLLILDARPKSEYQQGHIDGAVHLSAAATVRGDNGRLVPLRLLQDLFRRAGVSSDSLVIVYDSGIFHDAARIFWLLEVLGHSGKVAVLNSGYQEWVKEKFPVSVSSSAPAMTDFLVTVDPDRIGTKLAMRLAFENPNKTIIDARTAVAYSGKDQSSSDRKGHIPRAINIPADFNRQQYENGSRFKSVAELELLYSEIPEQNKVYVYCENGSDSALSYFALRLIGRQAAVYGGGWREWQSDPNLPIRQTEASSSEEREED